MITSSHDKFHQSDWHPETKSWTVPSIRFDVTPPSMPIPNSGVKFPPIDGADKNGNSSNSKSNSRNNSRNSSSGGGHRRVEDGTDSKPHSSVINGVRLPPISSPFSRRNSVSSGGGVEVVGCSGAGGIGGSSLGRLGGELDPSFSFDLFSDPMPIFERHSSRRIDDHDGTGFGYEICAQ